MPVKFDVTKKIYVTSIEEECLFFEKVCVVSLTYHL